jgi:hypothetical protein
MPGIKVFRIMMPSMTKLFLGVFLGVFFIQPLIKFLCKAGFKTLYKSTYPTKMRWVTGNLVTHFVFPSSTVVCMGQYKPIAAFSVRQPQQPVNAANRSSEPQQRTFGTDRNGSDACMV